MMASFVLVFSAIALSIVEGYIDPQEAYEKSFGDIDSRVVQNMTFYLQWFVPEYELIEDFCSPEMLETEE